MPEKKNQCPIVPVAEAEGEGQRERSEKQYVKKEAAPTCEHSDSTTVLFVMHR